MNKKEVQIMESGPYPGNIKNRIKKETEETKKGKDKNRCPHKQMHKQILHKQMLNNKH